MSPPYLDVEESVEDGQPVYLYLIQNLDSTFAYTSAQDSVTFQNVVYEPIAIEHGEPSRQSVQDGKAANVTISVPLDNAFAARYITLIPSTPDSVTIYRFHSTDGTMEAVVYFRGVVESVKFDDKQARAAVISAATILGDEIPHQTFRSTCEHILYDGRCQVIENLFTLAGGTVTAISTNRKVVRVDGGASVFPQTGLALGAQLGADANWLNAGFIKKAGIDHRMIQGATIVSGNEVDLDFRFGIASLTVGDSVDLIAGCDHSFSICGSKFSNQENFGGFPFIPTRNPHDTGNIT